MTTDNVFVGVAGVSKSQSLLDRIVNSSREFMKWSQERRDSALRDVQRPASYAARIQNDKDY